MVSRIGRYPNPYVVVEMAGEIPAGSSVKLLTLESEDRAASHAALWLPPGKRPATVATLMHPRADFLRHYLVPGLLESGVAVLTQNSRWVGNDSMLEHERVLLDVAAGMKHLRDLGFERIVAIGNSGGGSLYTFYISQAHAAPGSRLDDTAAGDPCDLASAELPTVDGVIYVAAHRGEGLFLLEAIDPSVVDESDPLACNKEIDMYEPANGFTPPPEPSSYTAEFVTAYRSAQRERVARIDARARELTASRHSARDRTIGNADDVQAWRQTIAVNFMTVYRTEADPRYTDPGLEPSARDYGSLFGYRPDLINYGPFGFARLVTPEAWLSTWSGLSSRASVTAAGAGVDVPALIVDYDADNGCFPSDAALIDTSLASTDKTRATVPGDHYGKRADGAGTDPRRGVVEQVHGWLDERSWL